MFFELLELLAAGGTGEKVGPAPLLEMVVK